MSSSVYLECMESGASKFWCGSVKGKVLTTRWGKIGTQGQSKEQSFADAASAAASLEKQAAVKVKKGYRATGTVKKEAAAVDVKASAAKGRIQKSKAALDPRPERMTEADLTAWIENSARTGAELASVVGRFVETDRLIAAHLATLPLTLSKLSRSRDMATCAKVAANQNTLRPDYMRLAQRFPGESLANPLFDLMSLEDPDFPRKWMVRLEPATLIEMAIAPECPSFVLEYAAALPRKLNRHSLSSLTVQLGQSRDLPERALFQISDPFWDGNEDAEFFDCVVDANRHIILALLGIPEGVARNPKTSPLVLQSLARDGNDDVRCGVAQNVQATPSLLGMLAEDKATAVRKAVAFNRNSPANLLDSLGRDRSASVRRMVAENLHTPAYVLEVLARDDATDVRMAVGDNPHTPSSALTTLGSDKSADVRNAVARNLMTPELVLQELAGEQDKVVRIGLAENPRLPTALHERLVNDTDEWVRLALADHSQERGEEAPSRTTIPEKTKRGYVEWDFGYYFQKRRPSSRTYRYYMMRHWTLSQDLLEALAAEHNSFIADAARKKLAQIRK